jgi:hypothetical protein
LDLRFAGSDPAEDDRFLIIIIIIIIMSIVPLGT